MLGTPRARSNGPAFALGCRRPHGRRRHRARAGERQRAGRRRQPETWVSVLKLLFGLLFLLLAGSHLARPTRGRVRRRPCPSGCRRSTPHGQSLAPGSSSRGQPEEPGVDDLRGRRRSPMTAAFRRERDRALAALGLLHVVGLASRTDPSSPVPIYFLSLGWRSGRRSNYPTVAYAMRPRPTALSGQRHCARHLLIAFSRLYNTFPKALTVAAHARDAQTTLDALVEPTCRHRAGARSYLTR